jgi:hypothetical protein
MKQEPESLAEVKERGIRPYPNLDVVLTYQNFGSAWLCVLRGNTENIDLVFNGLFNLCATNGDYQFFDHLQTVAVFWSDRKAMRRFFFNQTYLYESQPCLRAAKRAMRKALDMILKLRANGHEFFMDFSNQFVAEIYATGQMTAERPDSDFKDAVLSNAFKDRD